MVRAGGFPRVGSAVQVIPALELHGLGCITLGCDPRGLPPRLHQTGLRPLSRENGDWQYKLPSVATILYTVCSAIRVTGNEEELEDLLQHFRVPEGDGQS